jgi:nitroreductase
MNTIFSRRSIRHYKSQPVTSDQLEKLLRAGMAAPSAGNEQAWEFIIIDRRELLDAIPDFHPYAWMCTEAQVAILVCGNTAREKHSGMWVQDCSAATENILLEATDLGLGTVWVGVHPREERMNGFRKLLAIDDPQIIPFSLIPIGYPDEVRPERDNYDATRIHHNKW